MDWNTRGFFSVICSNLSTCSAIQRERQECDSTLVPLASARTIAFPPSAPPLNYNNNYYNNSEKCHRKSTENPSNFFPSTELSWFYSFSLLDHVIVAGARKNRYISSRIAGNREEGSERRAFYFVARHITKDCDKFRHRTITRLPFRLTQGPVDVLDVDLSLYRLGEDTTTTTTKGGEEKKG